MFTFPVVTSTTYKIPDLLPTIMTSPLLARFILDLGTTIIRKTEGHVDPIATLMPSFKCIVRRQVEDLRSHTLMDPSLLPLTTTVEEVEVFENATVF